MMDDGIGQLVASSPLKEYQPAHTMVPPMTSSGMLWCDMRSFSRLRRGASIFATTSPAQPAEVWMFMPPAKSMAPRSSSQPSGPQSQCVSG